MRDVQLPCAYTDNPSENNGNLNCINNQLAMLKTLIRITLDIQIGRVDVDGGSYQETKR